MRQMIRVWTEKVSFVEAPVDGEGSIDQSVCAARDRGGLKGGQRERAASAQDPGR